MTSTLHEMNRTGDSRIEWDPNNPDEVEIAKRAFDALKKKGYLTYRTRRDGSAGEVIRTFDPTAEKILATPQIVGG